MNSTTPAGSHLAHFQQGLLCSSHLCRDAQLHLRLQGYAHSMEASCKAQHAQRKLAALLEAGQDPRSSHLTKQSLGAHLLIQILFGNRHTIAPQFQTDSAEAGSLS